MEILMIPHTLTHALRPASAAFSKAPISQTAMPQTLKRLHVLLPTCNPTRTCILMFPERLGHPQKPASALYTNAPIPQSCDCPNGSNPCVWSSPQAISSQGCTRTLSMALDGRS